MNNAMSWFNLNWSLLCYLATVVGDKEIGDDKNEGESLAISIAMVMQWYTAGRIARWRTSKASLEATIGQVLTSLCCGGCHGRKINWNHTNTNKTHLLASNYGAFWLLVVCENIIPQKGPSTQLIDAPSYLKMWNATIGAEELADISSYQTLSGDKK